MPRPSMLADETLAENAANRSFSDDSESQLQSVENLEEGKAGGDTGIISFIDGAGDDSQFPLRPL